MPEMSTDERVLCDIQGRLFENSLTAGYDSPSFIAAFMDSEIAEYMDKPYDRYQWAGEEYLMEALLDETKGLPEAGILKKNDVSILHCLNSSDRVLTDNVIVSSKFDLLAKQVGKSGGYGRQGLGNFVFLGLNLAKM